MKLQALKLNFGNWRGGDPNPAWEQLALAPLWTQPEWEGLRVGLAEGRSQPAVIATRDALLQARNLPVEPQTEAEREHLATTGERPTRRLYVYKAADAVPQGVTGCDVRAAVLLLPGEGSAVAMRPCAQLREVATRCPVLIYGLAEQAADVARQLLAASPTARELRVECWIKSRANVPGQHHEPLRRLAIIVYRDPEISSWKVRGRVPCIH